MGPLALIVVLLGLDRLLVGGNRLARTGAGRRWRETRPAALAYLRSAPVSGVYLFILLITTWVLQTSSARIANQLLLERSTNLHQLAHDPIRVLVASAFWLDTTWQLVLWVPLVLVIVAPLERMLGSGRTIGVLAAGHIGATLLTAGGLWLALRADAVEHSVANARDVGPSYAFFAAAGCLAVLLEAAAARGGARRARRLRRPRGPRVDDVHRLRPPARDRDRARLRPRPAPGSP